MEQQISKAALIRSINFHGPTLQKACESYPKLQDMIMKTSAQSLSMKEFNLRQKHFTFQDRGKRARIQDFIAKHAPTLFEEAFIAQPSESRLKVPVDESFFAANPPFEAYCKADKESKTRRFFETTKVGDTLLCVVSNKQSVYGAKILVVEGEKPYVVADLGIKAVLHFNQVIGNRMLIVGDTVRTTVTEIVPEVEKIVIGDADLYTEPLPAVYKKATNDVRNESYDAALHKNPGFHNPTNISYLATLLGLGSDHHSQLLGLRGDFPMEEYAGELRQQQAAKWAFKSVADGIEHFKAARHSEAFQCLHKALSIDPRNVEGLVARGALYANSGNFKKAIEDFEMAIKVNPTHPNARKYLGETLVAFGRSLEEKNEMEEAMRAYEQCLVLFPYHEDARDSIEFLRSKNVIMPKDVEEKKPKKEKKKKSKKKKRASSSGSSSSSSSSSSDSSSESSSDSSSSASSHSSRGRKKRKKKSKKERKEKSLSPLSKRMQLMDSGVDIDGAQRNQCNPASFTKTTPDKERDYEMRVRSFIEQARDDSDYEEKVRKFLSDTMRLKHDRKSVDEKEKKKKKKDKKDKRDKSKKRKRDDKDEKKHRKRSKKDKTYGEDEDDEDERLREALRKELTMKQELRRRVAAHEAMENENVQLKLGGYYFKPKDSNKKYEEKGIEDRRHSLEKVRASPKNHRGKSEDSDEKGKKNIDIFEESPPQNKANKIQIGPISASTRYAMKKDREEKPVWESSSLKRIPEKPKSPPLPPPNEPPAIKTAVDKFSFRVKVIDPPAGKPGRRSRSTGSTGSRGGRKSSGSPRSRSYNSRSRSRSRDSRSRSRSHSRSRSRSYGKYSRSRSRSPRRYVQRYRGNQRGTYYKPRFQNNMPFRPMRGRDGYSRGGNRGGYYHRYERFDRGRGRGGYIPRGHMRGQRRGGQFYPRGPGPYYDRRRYHDDDRRRSRDRSRSPSYEDEDTMRKVGAAKEKIDKRIEMEEKEETRRRTDEPLSEGEAPDSPPPNGEDYASKVKTGLRKEVKEGAKSPQW